MCAQEPKLLEYCVSISQIFYNLMAGFAALLGSIIFIPEIRRWFKIKKYKRIYPLNSQGKNWRLIDKQGETQGIIYVHDLLSKLKYHVANPATMVGLDFDWNSVQHLPPNEFDNIKPGEPAINIEKEK